VDWGAFYPPAAGIRVKQCAVAVKRHRVSQCWSDVLIECISAANLACITPRRLPVINFFVGVQQRSERDPCRRL